MKRYFLLFLCVITFTGCRGLENGNDKLRWKWAVNADKYTDIFFADEDVLAVKNEMNKWALVNMNGEEIIPFEYDSVSSYSDGTALVKKGGVFLFVNRNGESIGGCTYDEARSFSENLACVKVNEVWGYIDITGNIVIPGQFHEAKSFSEGIAAVELNGKWAYIDTTGRMLTDYIYDEAYSFSEDVAVVALNDKYGIIDKNGIEVVPCQYDMLNSFSEGYASVKKNGKWGFLDRNGNICIDFQYDRVKDFSEGKAAVMREGMEGEADAWAYIDIQGNVKIDFFPYEATEGRMVAVGEFKNGMAFVSKALYCIIDDAGQDIFDGNSKFFVSALSYNKEYNIIPAYVYVDEEMTIKKYGLMGLNGEERIEPVFDYIYQMKNNYVVVSMLVDGIERKGVIELEIR